MQMPKQQRTKRRLVGRHQKMVQLKMAKKSSSAKKTLTSSRRKRIEPLPRKASKLEMNQLLQQEAREEQMPCSLSTRQHLLRTIS